MSLTENAEANAILGGNGCASAGMVGGIVGASGKGGVFDARKTENVFTNALECIKIGISNIVLVFAIYHTSKSSAFFINPVSLRL